MWQWLVSCGLLARRCRVGCSDECRAENQAKRDTEGGPHSDADRQVLQGRPQRGADAQTHTDADANACVFEALHFVIQTLQASEQPDRSSISRTTASLTPNRTAPRIVSCRSTPYQFAFDASDNPAIFSGSTASRIAAA